MKKIVRKHGFTLVELMIAIGIIITLAALSINGLLRVRITTNEAAAIKTLRTLYTAFVSYRAVNPVYPDELVILASENPPYIDSSLASGTRNGYDFTVSQADEDTFTIAAVPSIRIVTGEREFQIDELGEISEIREGAVVGCPDCKQGPK